MPALYLIIMTSCCFDTLEPPVSDEVNRHHNIAYVYLVYLACMSLHKQYCVMTLTAVTGSELFHMDPQLPVRSKNTDDVMEVT